MQRTVRSLWFKMVKTSEDVSNSQGFTWRPLENVTWARQALQIFDWLTLSIKSFPKFCGEALARWQQLLSWQPAVRQTHR